jgi:regulatory protein
MQPKYSLLEARQKIEAFCAYQERCDQEVRKKLNSWNLYQEDVDILIADLISHNFLNEERFAKSFVSGKFRIKKWGRIKIKQALKQKQISAYSINKGMEKIDPADYLDTLAELAIKKSRLINGDAWQQYTKLQRYLNGKGFERDLIIDTLEKQGLKPT